MTEIKAAWGKVLLNILPWWHRKLLRRKRKHQFLVASLTGLFTYSKKYLQNISDSKKKLSAEGTPNQFSTCYLKSTLQRKRDWNVHQLTRFVVIVRSSRRYICFALTALVNVEPEMLHFDWKVFHRDSTGSWKGRMTKPLIWVLSITPHENNPFSLNRVTKMHAGEPIPIHS